MHNIIKKYPVIAILRSTPQEDLEAYTSALYEGGLRVFEVSFSSKTAASQLEWMKEHMASDTCIGAGTVLTREAVETAVQAGADFLLSPSTNPEVLDYCRVNKIPLLPGVFSPTDVSVCLSYGFHTLKLFPAAELPLQYIKSLKGPFPDTEFVAVGGVTPQNTSTYLTSGFAGVGIGSSLVDKSLFQEKNWTQITENIRLFLNSLKEVNLL
ncbi:MAG TPA: bifunctional 4-hydroxy-2-oxoglutarate aldolase/2-dehydro-3-deoxy-phosphogluconate aldolase [Candidatus Mediterraneibacter norfolkensis]|nr:bifunctional 4-hydroxy-2-oxoglutarate aldolase/2-dehydro-3-deoxy-phosphogluconate aldolase [Candidatus Mediterraneibacter norfolkensis]